jgi:antitoxin CcdA
MTQALIPNVIRRKRAANLSLRQDVVTDARALGINLSRACEQHLCELIRRERERRWRTEHAGFMTAYNATVEQSGLPLEHWKTF